MGCPGMVSYSAHQAEGGAHVGNDDLDVGASDQRSGSGPRVMGR